jgi:transposase
MMNTTKDNGIEQENTHLQQQISELLLRVKLLTDENLMLRQRLFGRSSEKKMTVIADGQMNMFNEAEQESDDSVPEPELEQIIYKRRKQQGKREIDFAGLPVEQILHELPEDKRVCPECGEALHARGHDVLRRELTVIPAEYKVTEHVQTVYACRACEENAIETPMVKAEVPAPVIRGSGIASPSLVAYIANQKYTLALPLYRQEQEFQRNHLQLSRQTMANWLIYASEHWLMPIYKALQCLLILAKLLHADETPVRVLHEEGKPAKSKSMMWMYRTGGDAVHPIVLYDYQSNRRHINPRLFLEGFSGYLHSDGYQAYDHLSSGVIAVRCWAHVRRKFTDILKSIPDYNKPGSIALRGVEYCDALFALEREYAKNFNAPIPTDANFASRYEQRLKRSKPVMDEFFNWVQSVYGTIMALPRSKMGAALAYAMNQRRLLENVLLDGRLELSNNRAERSIKPFVIGRKNWLFSNTEKGADASAIFYSIIETAKENGLMPYAYLKYVFETAPNIDINNQEELALLLPWNVPGFCRSLA